MTTRKKTLPSRGSLTWGQVYESPEKRGSLGGVRRFAQQTGLPLPRAKKILEGLLSYTLHKPRRKRFPTLPVVVFARDEQWVADLVDVSTLKKWNKGFRFILTVVDVLSKYAWAVPLKNKTGQSVTEAFRRILKGSKGRQPTRLQTDLGKEFYNRPFQSFLKDKGIEHFSTHGDSKAAVVERWNRTLKERMYRMFTAMNTLSYVDRLPLLVRGYNATPHRSIGMAPFRVTRANERTVWDHLYARRLQQQKRPTLKVGDRVRLNKKHRPFKKGYLPGWTEEVFFVRRAEAGSVPTYKLQEWDGTPLKGTFYQEDVQKVHVLDDALFRVEKVVRRRGPNVLVRWKGWPDKYDSWIPKRQLTRL